MSGAFERVIATCPKAPTPIKPPPPAEPARSGARPFDIKMPKSPGQGGDGGAGGNTQVRAFDNTTMPRAPGQGTDSGAGGNRQVRAFDNTWKQAPPTAPRPTAPAAVGADGGAGGYAPAPNPPVPPGRTSPATAPPPPWGADGGAGGQPAAMLVDDVLHPGESRNLGPVAGTGADPGIPGIGAADLGEVITLPNGQQVMILGDSFSGSQMGAGDHYPSAAVPVHFENGKMIIDGPPLTGPDGSSNVLFPLPPQAAGTNSLPAGSIRMRDGTIYMMVAGTDNLNPTGGSWLVKATDDPAQGWQPIDGSWRGWTPNAQPTPSAPHPGTTVTSQPTQISGYQAADGNVYIAANSFDRSQGVTMYRVDPAHVTDRGAWQPWTGNGWGTPGQVARAPISAPNTRYGELSFQDIGGKPVLSGFNGSAGSVDLHIGDAPTSVFDGASTVVAPGGHWDHPVPGTYPQNYGGYILPGSTLDDMEILVSQWNTATDTPYVVEQFQVNPNR